MMTTISPLRLTRNKKHACVKNRNLKRGTYSEADNVSEKEYTISLEKNSLDLLQHSVKVTEFNEIEDRFLALDQEESVIVSRPHVNHPTTCVEPQSQRPHSEVTNKFPPPSTSPRRRSRGGRRSCPTQVCPAESHPLYSGPKMSEKENQDNLGRSVPNHQTSKSKKRSHPRGLTWRSNRSPLITFQKLAQSISSLVQLPTVKFNLWSRWRRNSTPFSLADALFQFMDEPGLPRLEDVPTSALRQYLNPITNAPIEAHIPSTSKARKRRAQPCRSSIQMQTYKVSNSRFNLRVPIISRRTQPTETKSETSHPDKPGYVIQQRDMRENGDFMRIAVMEMLMRKRGKLDDHKPGKARWVLPPRTLVSKPYEMTEDGVPLRWIPCSVPSVS